MKNHIKVFKLILLIFACSGCTAYITGNKWYLEGDDNWKEIIEERSRNDHQSGDLRAFQCNENSLFVGTNKIKVSETIGVMLVPLSIGDSKTAEKDRTLQIFLKYPYIAELCRTHGENLVKLNYSNKEDVAIKIRPELSFDFSGTKEPQNYCVIETSPNLAEKSSIKLLFNENVFKCEIPELNITFKKYRCLKSARWGGTDCNVE